MNVAHKDSQKIQKIRFQLDLLEQQAEMFDALKDECGLETRKELFNVAMTLFHWAVKETKNGRKIASYDPIRDDVETVVMPALEFLQSQDTDAGRHQVRAQRPQKSKTKQSSPLAVVSRANFQTT